MKVVRKKGCKNIPMIKLKDIAMIYKMGEEKVEALKEINLSIDSGEFVAIMGSSGSGKSTLLNILGCLEIPSFGSYFLHGKDINNLSTNELSEIRNQYIGFIFQSFHLLPRLNLIKNVEVPMLYNGTGKRERRERAKKLLTDLGLGNRLSHNPNELSGGQRQRVAIARSLVNYPKVLLADEPTGNLDTKTTYEIMEILKKLNDEGVTIIFVTHEKELTSYTNRTIILKDGLIISDEKK